MKSFETIVYTSVIISLKEILIENFMAHKVVSMIYIIVLWVQTFLPLSLEIFPSYVIFKGKAKT